MTPLDASEIVVGPSGADHLSIRVLSRMYPPARDFSDGNWLAARIEVRCGGFRGDVTAALRAEELRSFREEVEQLYAALAGEAVLASMEGWLTLRIAVTRLGALSISGTLLDAPGVGNELSFRIEG